MLSVYVMVNTLTMNQLSQYPHLNWYVSNLRCIPAGTYRYGAVPRLITGTQISISAFWMGATPVTWGIWKEYRQSLSVPGKGIKLPQDPGWGYPDDHPVVNVSWDDIMNPGGFCEWASSKAGFKLTLPTDAQWEYAACGGKDGLEYPWGNAFDASKLWCSNTKPRDAKQTAAVDRSNRIYRNGYGLTDMVGNVCHWCFDYDNDNYQLEGIEWSDTRYVRGGSWFDSYPGSFRCANRSSFSPDSGSNVFGFRLSAGQK
jgi:formylglycine-generating enzyme required for sulfatase activity